jgi:hypothetical protein
VRVIVRFSLNNDQASALRNILFLILENGGITRTGVNTGTYEGEDIDEADLRNVLAQFWNTLSGYMGNAHLDHFWMYVDKKRSDDEENEDNDQAARRTRQHTLRPASGKTNSD